MKTGKDFLLPERYSFKSIWRITFPILVALVMEELLGMTDTAFLGRVGEIELGASAIAGVYFTILYMLGFGFTIGVQIIIGRRNGEACESGKGFGAIGRVFWQGVWFLSALAVVTMVLSYFLSPPLLKGILKSENIFNAAVVYVNWRVPGLFFAFMTALFRAFYVGTRETASLTLNSIVMVGSNILLDWVLIFGHWGGQPHPELHCDGGKQYPAGLGAHLWPLGCAGPGHSGCGVGLHHLRGHLPVVLCDLVYLHRR